MKILSIDTSCDESCVAIIDTDPWRLEADIVHSHIDAMKRFGGVVPEVASREHLKALPLALSEAMASSGLELQEIDWFTVTNRPGLIGALLVGVSFTKALAFSLGKPFSTMNHIEAHLFSPLLATLDGKAAPPFPWLALVVSGGHTELFHVEGIGRYRWLGGTLDDAAGEAFDKIGKLLGMSYPAGPTIDRLLQQKSSDSERSAFPFPRAETKGFHFSFSGLKTAVALQIKKLGEIEEAMKIRLLASAQEAILDPLVDKLKGAKRQFPEAQLVVTGGVACNSRLRSKLPEAHFPIPRHCTDNAAMVALLSALYAREGKLKPSPLETGAFPSLEESG